MTRNGAIDLIAGAGAVGGIEASVFREEELLPPATADAEEQLAPWRDNHFWAAPDGEEHKAAVFQFGVAAHNKRPVMVLEKTRDKKGYLNPLRVYADTDGGGALRRSAARAGKPETIPSYFLVPFSEAIDALRAGRAYSLIGFDRRASHFFPFCKKGQSTDVEEDTMAMEDGVGAGGEATHPAEGLPAAFSAQAPPPAQATSPAQAASPALSAEVLPAASSTWPEQVRSAAVPVASPAPAVAQVVPATEVDSPPRWHSQRRGSCCC